MARLGCALTWLIVVIVGCAPAPATGPVGAPAAGSEVGPSKTLVVGQPRAREGFAPWFMRGSGRILQYEELHSEFLVSIDAQGALEGRLAERLPSFEDGTIQLLPDGQMRTTWKLRGNVKWQDGQPFTADDIVFSWQVSGHPDIPVQQGPVFRAMGSVEAQDALTLVITYKTTFYQALEVGFRDLYPLPKHLLFEPFQGDKEAFTRLPYFSTQYVHAGPFRVTEFMAGESVTMERFDDYFRGRPKLNRIVLRFIGDDNAMVSNLLAGAVDITGELPDHLAAGLRDDWKVSGAGYLLSAQGNWRFISIQFHPEWGGPPELQRDARVRRALLLAIDRNAIRDVVVPGFPDTDGDTFMLKNDPRTPTVGKPFARHQFDPTRAAQELADAGWRRSADGRLLNAAGQPVRLDIRTTGAYETELSAVANDWRRLGIDVTQEVMTRALSQDREYIAKYPSTEITAQSNSDGVLRRFDSREQPLAENRFVGSNAGHYVNSEADRLITQFYSTVPQQRQAELLREIGELLATDLPVLPMYFSVNALVALKHVRGLDDFPAARGPGQTARNAHLWDRA